MLWRILQANFTSQGPGAPISLLGHLSSSSEGIQWWHPKIPFSICFEPRNNCIKVVSVDIPNLRSPKYPFCSHRSFALYIHKLFDLQQCWHVRPSFSVFTKVRATAASTGLGREGNHRLGSSEVTP